MNSQWKMVPVEPTAEMEDVGCQAYMDAEGMIGIMHKSSMGHAFQAMLAAAPVPPAGEEFPQDFKPWPEQPMPPAGGVQFVGYPPVPEDRKLPPAGGVEVKRYDMSGFGDGMIEVADGAFVYFDDHSAHVTRLTAERDEIRAIKDSAIESIALLHAERDGLLAEVQSLKTLSKAYIVSDGDRSLSEHSLRAELTKARELNALLFEQARKRDSLLASTATQCSGSPNSCPNNEGYGCDCGAQHPAPAAKGGE